MSRQLVHNFTISATKISKIRRANKTFTRFGKKCHAIVIKDNGALKARLISSPVEEHDVFDISEFKVIPFTPNSFNLKGKTHVFLKRKDKYGHYICIIRNNVIANRHPGLTSQYNALREGLEVAGHIAKQGDDFYFDYENLIAFKENGAYINYE